MLQTFVGIDYLLNYIGLKLLQLLQDFVLFLPSFVLSVNFFVLTNNFIVSGHFNSSLYPSFILNTDLLLIPLM